MSTHRTPKNLICSIIGHRYYTTRNVSTYFKEYKCRCCGIEATTSSRGSITILTEERRAINETIHYLFLKKQLHLSIS